MSTIDTTNLGSLFHRCAVPGCRTFGCYGVGSLRKIKAVTWWCEKHVPADFYSASHGTAPPKAADCVTPNRPLVEQPAALGRAAARQKVEPQGGLDLSPGARR